MNRRELLKNTVALAGLPLLSGVESEAVGKRNHTRIHAFCRGHRFAEIERLHFLLTRDLAAPYGLSSGKRFMNGTLVFRETDLPTLRRIANGDGRHRPLYVDQLPSIDVEVQDYDERGRLQSYKLGGVMLVNEGYGYVAEDLVPRKVFTYGCRTADPLKDLDLSLPTSKSWETWKVSNYEMSWRWMRRGD